MSTTAERTYTTEQGDTWDAVAFKVYGDTKYTGWLMQNNFPLLDIFVFSAGTVLQTPDASEDENTADAPIWREATT